MADEDIFNLDDFQGQDVIDNTNEISSQKHNIKKLPKIKSDNPFKIDIKMKNSEPIILYNKLSEKISTKSKHKKIKKEN